MNISTEEEARRALRLRQGHGARYDAPSAPADALLEARRATAILLRKLNEHSDSDLDLPASQPEYARRRFFVIAGYHARILAEMIGAMRHPSPPTIGRLVEVHSDELEWGMTLPSHALRHLVRHSAIHLDVEWRDLTDPQWDLNAIDRAGTKVALRATPVLREQTLRQCIQALET